MHSIHCYYWFSISIIQYSIVGFKMNPGRSEVLKRNAPLSSQMMRYDALQREHRRMLRTSMYVSIL